MFSHGCSALLRMALSRFYFLEERQVYCACALLGLGHSGLTLALGPCGTNIQGDGGQGSASQPILGPLKPSQPAVQVGEGSGIMSLARMASPEPVLTWCQLEKDTQCLIWRSL